MTSGQPNDQHPPGTRPIAPRVSRAPKDVLDSVDRQLTRATADDPTMDRYLELLGFVRSTILIAAALALIGCLAVGVGLGTAIYVAGMTPRAAAGLGTIGAVTTTCIALYRGRLLFKRLPALIPTGSTAPPELNASPEGEPTDQQPQ